MTSIDVLINCHNLVTICDVTEHILPLIQWRKVYLTIPFFKTILNSVYPSGYPKSSSITIHYSTFIAVQLTLTYVTRLRNFELVNIVHRSRHCP